MKRYLIPLLITLSFTISQAQNNNGDIIQLGDKTPQFSITTLNGETFDVVQLKGKIIYLNFFATWCGPCMKELPHVEEKIWKPIKDTNFVMLVIGREHKTDELIKFREQKGFTFPMAADPERKIYGQFAHQNIPRNIVIDKSGKVIYSKHGFTEKAFDEMIQLIQKNL
ncbi:MAG: TlpA family protein disulfide reductase [Salinivirgaceae bacterium]